LLRPAYDVSRYAPNGYLVRLYGDLQWTERLLKAWAMLTETHYFSLLERPQVYLLRSLAARSGPTRLHFTRLNPNYTDYWMADSTATTSVSYHEIVMWFRSRGDRCLNCPPETLGGIVGESEGLYAPMMVIQIDKPQ